MSIKDSNTTIAYMKMLMWKRPSVAFPPNCTMSVCSVSHVPFICPWTSLFFLRKNGPNGKRTKNIWNLTLRKSSRNERSARTGQREISNAQIVKTNSKTSGLFWSCKKSETNVYHKWIKWTKSKVFFFKIKLSIHSGISWLNILEINIS